MLNTFQKLLYYLTAEAPFLFVVSVVWLIEKSEWRTHISWKVPLVLILVAVLLVLLCKFISIKAINHLPIRDVTVKEFKPDDHELRVYVETYLLPLISAPFVNIRWLIILLLAVLLLVVLTSMLEVSGHPVLSLLGYHYYSVDIENGASACKLATKRKINNPESIKKVVCVFDYFLVEVG